MTSVITRNSSSTASTSASRVFAATNSSFTRRRSTCRGTPTSRSYAEAAAASAVSVSDSSFVISFRLRGVIADLALCPTGGSSEMITTTRIPSNVRLTQRLVVLCRVARPTAVNSPGGLDDVECVSAGRVDDADQQLLDPQNAGCRSGVGPQARTSVL